MDNMFDEREVVSKILQGNFRAFTLLVSQYEKLVFFVVNRIVRNSADRQDISQEVFLKVHRNLPSFRFKSKLSTWIARIAYLTAIDYVKKYRHDRKRDHPEDLDNFHFTPETPELLLEIKDRAELLERLIALLPDNYRIVLTLYHLNEFSCLDIKEITGIPEGTVKSYLFRARLLLKEHIKTILKDDEL